MAQRRQWLMSLAGLGGWADAPVVRAADAVPWVGATAAGTDRIERGRPLVFPRDHGAHLNSTIEWWYVTGWLGSNAQAPSYGFQVTFFRHRTGLADGLSGRFAARHLLMAHGALTEVQRQTHRHTQGVARWSGQADGALRDRAAMHDADVALGPWHIRRSGENGQALWQARIDDASWSLALKLRRTQPVLLQGEAGYSRKGPGDGQASHYYSEPQLEVVADVGVDGRVQTLSGRAWLDHEWSDTLLHPDAVGWDWAGINLDDGGALTVFVLRRADGRALWAGGSHRPPGGAVRNFAANEVSFTSGSTWRSPATGAMYPVQWTVDCPLGRFALRSLLEAQEIDARASTGTVYWEGLSSLHDARGTRVGWGYLEMTGYAGKLRW